MANDEVDRICAAWARERPELDTEPLQVFSRVTRLARHLEIARRRAFAGHGLDAWEFDVLSALYRTGPPYELTAGSLLSETMVSSGTMTNRIDRLALKELVERATDTADRRVVKVRLTTRGRDCVDGALADLLTLERELLGPVHDNDATALAARLRTILTPLDSAE